MVIESTVEETDIYLVYIVYEGMSMFLQQPE